VNKKIQPLSLQKRVIKQEVKLLKTYNYEKVYYSLGSNDHNDRDNRFRNEL
jgi:hypothetical protein